MPAWRDRWESDDGSVVLYHGDALVILPTLDRDSIQAIVTDPPYGIDHPTNYNERGRGVQRGKQWPSRDYPPCHGDSEPFDPRVLLSLSLPTVLWGANYFASKLPDSSGWLVWDKDRPDELDQSTCELAWTNCIKGVRRFKHLWNGLCRASEIGEHLHPMQKPAALYEWILSFRWIPQGTVFDPYMGSCPCGVASIRASRSFIGCEIERPYFEIAVQRCKDELARFPLWEKPTPSPKQMNLLELQEAV